MAEPLPVHVPRSFHVVSGKNEHEPSAQDSAATASASGVIGAAVNRSTLQLVRASII